MLSRLWEEYPPLLKCYVDQLLTGPLFAVPNMVPVRAIRRCGLVVRCGWRGSVEMSRGHVASGLGEHTSVFQQSKRKTILLSAI
jgi:hypothetical protein